MRVRQSLQSIDAFRFGHNQTQHEATIVVVGDDGQHNVRARQWRRRSPAVPVGHSELGQFGTECKASRASASAAVRACLSLHNSINSKQMFRYSTLERVRFTASDVSALKSQLQRPPAAIAQTNALETSEDPKQWLKSASSSESLNSQDGINLV